MHLDHRRHEYSSLGLGRVGLLVFVAGERDVHNVALSEFVIRLRRFPDSRIDLAAAEVTFARGMIVPFAGWR